MRRIIKIIFFLTSLLLLGCQAPEADTTNAPAPLKAEVLHGSTQCGQPTRQAAATWLTNEANYKQLKAASF